MKLKMPGINDIVENLTPMLEGLSDFGQSLIIVEGRQKTIHYSNQAFLVLSGYSLHELQTLPSFLHLLNSAPPHLFSEFSNTPHELMLIGVSGRRVPVELLVRPLESFPLERFIIYVRDASRRKRKEDEINLFQTIGLSFNDSHDFSTALGLVLKKIGIATGWEYGEAWSPAPGELYLKRNPITYCGDQRAENLKNMKTELFLKRGEGFAGRTWEAGHPMWVDDLGRDSDPQHVQIKSQFGLDTAFAIPVMTNNSVIAILVFYVTHQPFNWELYLGLASAVTPQLGTLFLKKKAEENLKETNTFLDSIVENIPDMVFIKCAKNLSFVRFNKAGEKLLGISREELLGKTDYDFFPKEEADFFTKKDRWVLEEGKLVDIPEEKIHTKNGVRILHTKKIPILDENRKPLYLLGISEDITEKKSKWGLF